MDLKYTNKLNIEINKKLKEIVNALNDDCNIVYGFELKNAICIGKETKESSIYIYYCDEFNEFNTLVIPEYYWTMVESSMNFESIQKDWNDRIKVQHEITRKREVEQFLEQSKKEREERYKTYLELKKEFGNEELEEEED